MFPVTQAYKAMPVTEKYNTADGKQDKQNAVSIFLCSGFSSLIYTADQMSQTSMMSFVK